MNFSNMAITNQVSIGLFSFDKVDMYFDLKNNKDDVLNNKIIYTLFNPIEQIEKCTEIVDDSEISNFEEKLHNVVDADSSQMKAIELSKKGQSFVLKGPPGTGKSQTITNIIAEALYDGKSVLFVSEKLAALNVVYEKMRRVGLDKFCLSLHGNKTNKKYLYQDLSDTLNSEKTTITDNANFELQKYLIDKAKLDEYSNALHRPIGKLKISPYHIFSKYSQLKDNKLINFHFDNILNITKENLFNYIENLKIYKNIANKFPRKYWEYNCFNNFDIPKNNSFEYIKRLETFIENAENIISTIKSEELIQIINNNFFEKITFDELDNVITFLNNLLSIKNFDPLIFKKISESQKATIESIYKLRITKRK